MRWMLVVLLACGGTRVPENEMEDPNTPAPSGPTGTSGGEEQEEEPTPTYTVSGSVEGLTMLGMVLRQGAETREIVGNGPFAFLARLADGAAYDVLIETQPMAQLCSVTNGVGVIAGANVTQVVVSCLAATPIGGTVTGLPVGQSVTLLNNGGDATVISASGPFVMRSAQLPGGAYVVSVSVQPAGALCAVVAPSGSVTTEAVTSVKVVCVRAVEAEDPVVGNWNDYKGCVTDAPYSTCYHGGEHRAVIIGGFDDCTGLSVGGDGLNAFTWECVDLTGGAVKFVSTGLKPGRYLSDLIDFATGTWKANDFFIVAGGVQIRTPASVWWTNPIVKNASTLDVAGTVYAYDAAAGDLAISADRVALVTKPGVSVGAITASNSQVWIEGACASLALNALRYARVEKLTSAGQVEVFFTQTAYLRDITATLLQVRASSRAVTVNTVTADELMISATRNCVVQHARLASKAHVLSSFGTVLEDVQATEVGVGGSADTTVLGATARGGTGITNSGPGNRFFNVAAVDGSQGITAGSGLFFNYAAIGNDTDVSGSFAPGSGGTVVVGGSSGPWFDAQGRALQSDTVLRASATLPASSDDDFTHHFYVDGPSGCTAMFGNATYENVDGSDTCAVRAIMSAAEVPGGILNNGNSLCEQGEQCIALHNIGAFQGAGSRTPVSFTPPGFLTSIFRYVTTWATP